MMQLEGQSYRFSPADVAASRETEGLVLAARERLHPFVASAVRDPHAAEDILQEVLVVLIERVHRLRRPDRFWPWIYRIAWSKVQDHYRDHRRARQAVAAVEREPVSGDASAGDLLEGMVRREAVEHLAAAMGQLNPHCRIVLYLRFCEQMPYAQIALMMHSTPGRVRVQFHRAKRLLRESLLPSCA
ncbi:MAG: sigma-70 family RNA polymerase sigma factor [Sedimentisphaerales bacterium]|nr:sigma-70 family RNA polymerase sigma factor [Sedimentisphaerales bacterium]